MIDALCITGGLLILPVPGVMDSARVVIAL